MTRIVHHLVPAALALTLATGAATAETLRPNFDPDKFVPRQAIDNKYYPVKPGERAVLIAKGVDDEGERFHIKEVLKAVTSPRERIAGVRVTAQLDKEWENGLLQEKTYDYYAQDKRGNVWYMGEDVTNYRYDDNGNLIGTDSESAWIAGRRGAKPGWIMPARQIIGQRYFQEIARRDEALDKGKTHAILDRLRVGGTVYRNVLRVLETNPFEPNDREFKYYAPRVGVIRIEEGLNKNLRNPEVVYNRRDDDGSRAARNDGRRSADRGKSSGKSSGKSAGKSGGKSGKRR